MINNEPIETTQNRLNLALKIRGMKKVELSKITGIPMSSISHYTSGKVDPKQDRIYLIAKALNVSEAWLIGYDVPMERATMATVLRNEMEKKSPLIELCNSLTTEEQKMATVLIMTMLAQKEKDKEEK